MAPFIHPFVIRNIPVTPQKLPFDHVAAAKLGSKRTFAAATHQKMVRCSFERSLFSGAQFDIASAANARIPPIVVGASFQANPISRVQRKLESRPSGP
ncbi:hypothetical protein [Sulfitobacter sp. 20_GPM-1509m]|uniref:hypothetical protein n=1 Tax=Sulfitobacter sp. 20_GPM-1509m TaxID=1380367 RepID=UPI0012DF6703|nr:hypothetical protein [Sulfitobacter sp. 20_GPM-1509m]